MTRLFDDPARFAEDALAGFVDLHPGYVRGLDGGVVRSRPGPAGKVAVVVGGGAGHFPAFCGFVGPGFADGAVVGDVFTSPASEQIVRVARASHCGGGVLLAFGNYAGDVINFGLAQDQLRSEGIDTRTVLVTDDIASAPPARMTERRGVAGDFAVFKIAAAAAEAGLNLDDVERLARRTNQRTRTLGVAFAGCTLPGQQHPLFTVPTGRMGVGLGIHGEPGITEADRSRASDLACRLVDALLAEAPADSEGTRVAAILNGLGSTKHEELFIVWRSVSTRLAAAGLHVIEPEVGELVTSLDMAGVSLTLVWLDDELEPFWRASADTPAYRKRPGALHTAALESRPAARPGIEAVTYTRAVAKASVDSRRSAIGVLRALQVANGALTDAHDELCRLDATAGDGDHGRGMVKGSAAAVSAAYAAIEQGSGVAATLAAAGRAWAGAAGGTSGALWGAGLQAFGPPAGDQGPLTGRELVAGAHAALAAVQRLGNAEVGDKTLVDALAPFVQTLSERIETGADAAEAWAAAAKVAETSAQSTATLRPRRGRARPLADRSIGHVDPDATSLALVLVAIAEVFTRGTRPA